MRTPQFMKIITWKNWSIGKRLMFIAIFPVVYLFLSVVAYSYFSHDKEAKLELAERGNMVATTLAEGLEYPLLSANTNGLKQMVHAVVQSDQSIYKIEVFNYKKESVSSALRAGKSAPEKRYFEKPIKRQMVWINIVGQDNSSTSNTKLKNDIIGYVRVTMSPSHMVEKQKHRFSIELLISMLALAASVWVGRFLSQTLTEPLQQSIAALRQIRGGHTDQKMAITSGGELGELQHSINDMAESLHLAKQHLENTVEQRTSELMQSRNEALKANAEKRKLIQKINTIVEDERQSIAVEIHDELNASLIAVRLESELIVRLANPSRLENKTDFPPQFETTLQEIQTRARSVIQLALGLYINGRNLVRRLRPEVLEMLGLQGAVEDMVKMLNQSQGHEVSQNQAQPNIECKKDGTTFPQCHFSFVSSGDFSQVNQEMAMSCYRIIQEACSNVIKHAQASHVTITLHVVTHSDHSVTLNLVVQDDGNGFDQDAAVLGIGLIGMRERVAALQGEMQIYSKVGEGCKIVMNMFGNNMQIT